MTIDERRAITMSLQQVVDIMQPLSLVCNTKGMDIKTSYRLGRLQACFTSHTIAFEKERMKLINELGTEVPTPEGQPPGQKNFQIAPDKLPEFDTKMQALLSLTVTLDNIIPLKLADLAPANLSPLELSKFFPMLAEELDDPVENPANNSSIAA
jgi:hypothetical protein